MPFELPDMVTGGAVMVLVLLCWKFSTRTMKRTSNSLSHEEFINYKQHESSFATNVLSQDHIETIALRQWKTVLSWVAFHSDQVSRLEDTKGQTILHHAALFRAPSHVIESLLWASPELASVPNKDGELALHWAVRVSAPNPVLAVLLRANPESAFWQDLKGTSPLSLLWERHQLEMLQVWREDKKQLLRETNNTWRRIMSVFRAIHQRDHAVVASYEQSNVETFHPLHIAASRPTPPCLFPLLVQVYKEELSEADKNGSLPLSVACRFPLANRLCDVLTKIQLLLREFPAAATKVDPGSDQYPLHIALCSGVLWDDGVNSLLQAFPAAISMRSQKSQLFPFALAAYDSTHPSPLSLQIGDHDRKWMETIYRVLRADPSVLRLLCPGLPSRYNPSSSQRRDRRRTCNMKDSQLSIGVELLSQKTRLERMTTPLT